MTEMKLFELTVTVAKRGITINISGQLIQILATSLSEYPNYPSIVSGQVFQLHDLGHEKSRRWGFEIPETN